MVSLSTLPDSRRASQFLVRAHSLWQRAGEAAQCSQKATFRNSGLRVITAGTGTQALDLARAERPNLVLLEVGLPEMNGYKVCRALKSDPQTSAHIMRTGGAHCSCPVLHTQRRRSGAL